jgi:hypothetical protein
MNPFKMPVVCPPKPGKPIGETRPEKGRIMFQTQSEAVQAAYEASQDLAFAVIWYVPRRYPVGYGYTLGLDSTCDGLQAVRASGAGSVRIPEMKPLLYKGPGSPAFVPVGLYGMMKAMSELVVHDFDSFSNDWIYAITDVRAHRNQFIADHPWPRSVLCEVLWVASKARGTEFGNHIVRQVLIPCRITKHFLEEAPYLLRGTRRGLQAVCTFKATNPEVVSDE